LVLVGSKKLDPLERSKSASPLGDLTIPKKRSTLGVETNPTNAANSRIRFSFDVGQMREYENMTMYVSLFDNVDTSSLNPS
jgi:hypothetical protein